MTLSLFDYAVRELARGETVRRSPPMPEASGSAAKGYPPRARRSSTAETSRAAHRRVSGSGDLTAQQLAALSLVRAFPGRTATQLADLPLADTECLGADRVSRRFALCRRLGEIPLIEARKTGGRERTWWPR